MINNTSRRRRRRNPPSSPFGAPSTPAYAYLLWSASLCALSLSDDCSKSIVEESCEDLKSAVRQLKNRQVRIIIIKPHKAVQRRA